MERGLRAEPMLAQQLCQHRRHNPVEGVAAGDAQHAPFGAPVNGAAVFLKSGAAKFPSLAGRRSAVGVIGASILRLATATLRGR
jgi:hypothetical protein